MLKRLSIKISTRGADGIRDFVDGLPWPKAYTLKVVKSGCSLLDLVIDESDIDAFLSAIGRFVPDEAALTPCVLEADTDRPLDRPQLIEGLIAILPSPGQDGTHDIHANTPPFPVTIQGDTAFGLGTHPSTMGALRALAYLYRKGALMGKKVLDVGTGSGILSIAAWRLGANFVLGIDVDNRALVEAKENRALNGCPEDRVVFRRMSCTDVTLGGFDVILANLVPSVRDRFLKDKRRFSSPPTAVPAILVISGSKSRDTGYVSYVEQEHGFCVTRQWTIDGWLTTLFQRR